MCLPFRSVVHFIRRSKIFFLLAERIESLIERSLRRGLLDSFTPYRVNFVRPRLRWCLDHPWRGPTGKADAGKGPADPIVPRVGTHVPPYK
jgi:hypothetical protein